MSLNSGEARIIGGWGGIYIYMLYALWSEAREEGVSFVQEAVQNMHKRSKNNLNHKSILVPC